MEKKRNMHPNSLANLRPQATFKDNEVAKMAQKKSVEARKANQAARERLKVTAAELKLDIEEVMEKSGLTAIGVLRIAMLKALEAEDYDQAADLASKIAPFETPKLQAVEQTVKEVSADQLTDEELNERLKKLLEG